MVDVAVKRRRIATKTAEPLPLPRIWSRVEKRDQPDDGHRMYWPQTDKVTQWYDHPAALLDVLPLTEPMNELRSSFPVLETDGVAIRTMRALMSKLDIKPAHSFKYKGEWHSLSADALATFYEDRVLHTIGAARMADWWGSQEDSSARTGAALTFWWSLDGSDRLPDAVEAGLSTTALAEFEKVFCLCYPSQTFRNMPEHVAVLDCNLVLPEARFVKTLASNRKCVGFIAVLAEWLKLVGASSLEVEFFLDTLQWGKLMFLLIGCSLLELKRRVNVKEKGNIKEKGTFFI